MDIDAVLYKVTKSQKWANIVDVVCLNLNFQKDVYISV